MGIIPEATQGHAEEKGERQAAGRHPPATADAFLPRLLAARLSHPGAQTTEASSQEAQPVSRPRRAGDEHSSPSTWEGGWAQPLLPPPRAALQDQPGRGAKSGPFRASPLAGEGAALRAHSSRWLGLGGGAPALLASDPPSCLPGAWHEPAVLGAVYNGLNFLKGTWLRTQRL